MWRRVPRLRHQAVFAQAALAPLLAAQQPHDRQIIGRDAVNS
jgi:hypothetical protein